MTNPFKSDEWVELSDGEGNKAHIRHVATIEQGETTYLVIGAVRESEEGTVRSGFVLVREVKVSEDSADYIVEQDLEAIERVVSDDVAQTILEQIQEAYEEKLEEMDDLEDDLPACGMAHGPREFCFCGRPEFLQ